MADVILWIICYVIALPILLWLMLGVIPAVLVRLGRGGFRDDDDD